MNSRLSRRTATKGLLLALLLWTSLAWAGVAGTVTHLSGALFAHKPDGAIKALAVKSEVESGDTLVAEKNTYAQLRFLDNSQITLRPGTTFKIEKFAFESGKPEADAAAFNLVKGGLRSVSGELGKRNREKFELKTPGATIGIRGTTFTAEYVAPGAPAPAPAPGLQPGMPPGLYVHVLDGIIHLSNAGGSQSFTAGQFGFTPGVTQPPVIVPNNPGIKFAPPPAFSAAPPGTPSGQPQSPGAVDCVVR